MKKPASGNLAPVKASLEYALLGLIAELPGVSGYDIVKIFDRSMRHYWHARQGQIYPTLERMETDGWIRSREVIQRGRPNKRLYSITKAGQREMRGWLASPFEETKLKHAALLRTRFLAHLGPDGARAKLEEQRGAWQGYLDTLRAIEGAVFATNPAHTGVNMMFSWFTLRYGIAWMEESIRWCDWAIAEIQRNRARFDASPGRRIKP